MPGIAFVGDEVSAAGFRLAGIATYVPAPERVVETFLEQMKRRDMVMITAECANRLPARLLDEALAKPRPVVAVIPDIRGREVGTDWEAEVKRALGIEV